MRDPTQARRAAAILLALTFACGGKPAGGKLPRPNPTDVAFVAAAAAAATTLANPKAAGHKPEKNDDPREYRDPPKTDETVPADVLDRSEDSVDAPDAGVDASPPPAPATNCGPLLESVGLCPKDGGAGAR